MLVLKELNIQFEKCLPNKKTARCPEQIIGHDKDGNQFLIVYAKTESQKYYAKRSVENMDYFSKINVKGFQINTPVFYEELEDGYYIVYRYFETVNEIRNEKPHNWLLQYYKSAEIVKNSDEVIDKIESDFLECWEMGYREMIMGLPEFREFHEALKEQSSILICFQHGDFTPNNLLEVDGENYIMDFEFAMRYQPIGFDLYDYHYATDKCFTDIPYLKINEIKERLQNRVNELIDGYFVPKLISQSDCENIEECFAKNMVYNRPDIYGGVKFKKIYIRCMGKDYEINYIVNWVKAELCVWLCNYPANVLNFAADYIFKNEKVIKIVVNYSNINIHEKLCVDNNWVVFLPQNSEEIFSSMSKKSQYNFRREMRMLEEQLGQLKVVCYTAREIPSEIFENYFTWKLESHGTKYGLTGDEYIKQYHVTNAMALFAGKLLVAVLFYCKLEDTVYLENISYDNDYSKCSPGIILYEKFLENMTNEESKVVFLGNGSQTYKTRFGSREYIVYSGSLYRNKFFKILNEIKRRL